jgi:phosphocarrier protein
MSGEPVRRTVTLTNPQGLHMRPMSAFVQLAGRFQSQITVIGPEDKRADGRSMFGLLGLAAEPGSQLTVEATGPDAEAAAAALSQFLANLSEEQTEV